MIGTYLKITLRNIARHKIYSAITIIGLAVGMACAVLITLWIRYEMSYDTFHANADRIYRVGFTTEKKDYYGFWQPGPLAKYLKDRYPEIEQSTSYSEMKWKLSYGTRGFFCNGGSVDPAFFTIFTFPLEAGDATSALSAPNSVVISKSLAHKIFGEGSPVGKTLTLDDRPGVMVTGVFSDVLKTSQFKFDFLISFSGAPAWMNMWDRKCVETYVLLRSGASVDDVSKKIYGVMNEHNPSWKNVLFLFPVTKSHLYTPGGTGPIIYVYIFGAFGLLILIIACINFMNLSTARSEKRMKEIGIKKTVGATRTELVRQFMTETVLHTCLSLILTVVLVELSLPYLNGMLATTIEMTFSGSIILLLCGTALLTAVIAGSYPALYLSSFDPAGMLKGGAPQTGGRRSFTLRNALVVAQFTFSLFIIMCVLFISSQLRFIRSKNLGFAKEHVLLISTRGALQQKVLLVKDELLRSPFVKGATVSATDFTGFQGAGTGPIEWEGKNRDKLLEVGFNYVDEDFAHTFQIAMARGRFFSKDYSADMSDAFVVNEETAKEMGIENPVNMKMSTWFGRKGTIVGVIKDYHVRSLREGMDPVVLIPATAANYLCVRISPADIPGAIASIERKIKEIVPDDPFEYRFLDSAIDRLYQSETMTAELTTCIAVLAIFISCLGLFGLASFSSEQRTKEIGIRKVLGASVARVLLMLTRDFTKWVVLAAVIACPIAWYSIHAWLQNFAYRIDIAFWPFLLAGSVVLAIALLTVSYQAIKAATRNPVESLRSE
jgi:putative ABC transport system permease protein